jgi:hypothetical protein
MEALPDAAHQTQPAPHSHATTALVGHKKKKKKRQKFQAEVQAVSPASKQ